jgi:hypothetical protein
MNPKTGNLVLLQELARAIKSGRYWHVFIDGIYHTSFFYSPAAHVEARAMGGTAKYLTNVKGA